MYTCVCARMCACALPSNVHVQHTKIYRKFASVIPPEIRHLAFSTFQDTDKLKGNQKEPKDGTEVKPAISTAVQKTCN